MAINKKKSKGIGIYLIILLVVVLGAASVFTMGGKPQKPTTYQTILGYFQNGQVRSYTINFGTGDLVLNLKPTEQEKAQYEAQLK
ncbi:hypothetical protein EDD70_0590 [Hydrogenoanaerobacterium saccharovorans]|nr:ATP-dependent metallopeptidase FtsH/Yme1/Tma family protein [Hydrogenoanaerobacterium saccharovorans]RPF47790.1 hypothetical protein EDD70_0590 [Hydrogenoanaerobacterium saccharovorans]